MEEEMKSYHFRCVNRHLYGCMMVAVVASVIYAFAAGHLPEMWQQVMAVFSAVAVSAWGSYYTTLCIELDARKVRCGSWLRRRSYNREHCERVELTEWEAEGIQHCSITFFFPKGKKVEISTRLFSPDDIHALRDDLRSHGMLSGKASAQVPQEKYTT